MAITKEQALAELQRRGVQTTQQPTQQPTVAPAIFTQQQALQELQRRGADQKPESGFSIDSILEPAATLVSGAVAEPLAGLAGLAKAAFAPSPEEAVRRGTEAVGATREALTFQPKTEAGQEALQTVGGFLAPVGKALQAAETFLGDETFEATGSPALAAAATTLPTAIIEALGLASAKGVVKGAAKTRKLAKNREIRRSIVEAAPEREAIKEASRAVFKEIDDSGVTVTQSSFNRLVDRTVKDARKAGLDPDVTPVGQAAINRLQKEAGQAKTLTEIDTLRKVAQNAANALGPDSAIGNLIISNIDDFLDTASPDIFVRGTKKASDITPKYKVARELWGRAKRAELIEDAFTKAGEGNFTKDIATQFKAILKDTKKRRKFFKPDEIEAMQAVTKGTTPLNLARVIGKFGISENQILVGGLGATAAAVPFGAPGAIAVPIIGNVSKKLAGRLTRKGAEFADAIVRSGDKAEDIARTYLKNTSKAARSAEELSELLLRPDTILDDALISGNKIVKEAAEIAKGRKALIAAGVAAELGVVKEQSNQSSFLDKLKQIPQQDLQTDLRMANGNEPTLQPRLSQGLRKINGTQFGS